MVTLIELKQTGPERFLARFDNGEEIKTTLNVVTDLDLYCGKSCKESEIDQIRSASSLSLCKQRALRIIGARPMSVKELTDRLREKGEDPDCAEQTADWLQELHLLNDAEYAGMCVRHYASKGYGASKIRSELYRRGVPRELWDDALLELPEQDAQIDRLLKKKLRTSSPDRDALQKASEYLFRRGFSWDEIREAIDRFQTESEDTRNGI